MNYIELINNFWDLDVTWQFTCCETRLYFYLVKTANGLGWIDNWAHSDARTSANVGVSVNVMKTSRNKLIQAKLIEVKTGGKHHGDKCRYHILTPTYTPNLTPTYTPNLIPNLAPLNKLNKTKHNNISISAQENSDMPLQKKEEESPPVAPPPPFVAKGFFPSDEHMQQELPDIEIGKTKQFLSIKKKIDFGTDKILSEWSAFKINNFNGANYKENWGSIYKWFRDSLLYSLNNGNNTHQRGNKANSDSRNGGFQVLTGSLKDQLADIAGGREEDTLAEI